jgi:glycosyltransferase involved in cell wall biosynthesis
MTNPAITVVIPTRDDIATLPAALDSVDLQQVPDMEVIVVDDGSRDGSSSYLARRAEADTRLRVLTLPGVGPSAARNAALAIASAPLVAFLDADDQWHAGKLTRQIAAMQAHPSLAFCFTDYDHRTPDGAHLGTCFDYWKPSFAGRPPMQFELIENPEALLLGCNLVGTSTVVAQTEALRKANGFATELRSAEDWDLWLRLAASGGVACSTMVTTTYLVRPRSVTSDRSARIAAMESIMARYRDRHGRPFRVALRHAEARIAIAKAEALRERGAHWQACHSGLRAFGLSLRTDVLRSAGGDLLRGCRDLLKVAA